MLLHLYYVFIVYTYVTYHTILSYRVLYLHLSGRCYKVLSLTIIVDCLYRVNYLVYCNVFVLLPNSSTRFEVPESKSVT